MIKYYRFFVGYFLVLLAGVVVFYALPSYPGVVIEPEAEYRHIYDLAINNQLEEADWVRATKSWEFAAKESLLSITSGGDYLGTLVAVRESGQAGKVTVTEYTTNDMFGKRIGYHHVLMEDNSLVIRNPAQVNLKLYSFGKDLLLQFSAEGYGQDHIFDMVRMVKPSVLLLVEVPEGMEVLAEEQSTNILFLSDYQD